MSFARHQRLSHLDARAAVHRYVTAFEAADVDALVSLLTHDIVMEMPPVALWYRGPDCQGISRITVFQDPAVLRRFPAQPH